MHLNKCLRVSYAYKIFKERGKLSPENGADFKMDIVKQNQPRLVWIHKDETETQHQKQLYNDFFANDEIFTDVIERPCIQPIIQVCEKDTVEISINFASMQGLTDINSLEWFPPYLTIPTKETVLNYDKDRHQ